MWSEWYGVDEMERPLNVHWVGRALGKQSFKHSSLQSSGGKGKVRLRSIQSPFNQSIRSMCSILASRDGSAHVTRCE